MKLKKWRGSRPENPKIVGRQRFQNEHVAWMPAWFMKFLEAEVIKPNVKLQAVLYPRNEGGK